jgi:hypothetical protein
MLSSQFNINIFNDYRGSHHYRVGLKSLAVKWSAGSIKQFFAGTGSFMSPILFKEPSTVSPKKN